MTKKVTEIIGLTITASGVFYYLAEKFGENHCITLWLTVTTLLYGLHRLQLSITEENELQYKAEIDRCAAINKRLTQQVIKKVGTSRTKKSPPPRK